MEKMRIDKIVSKGNPRKELGDITELAMSIQKHGILTPLIVNKKNELLAGHRRLAAIHLVNMRTEEQITEVPVAIMDADEGNSERIKLEENIHRKDLNPVEEGLGFDQYMLRTGCKVHELAKLISKSETYIQARIDLLKLAAIARDAIVEGKIQLGHAKILLELAPQRQEQYVKEIKKEKMSVKEFLEHMSCKDDMVYASNLPEEIKKKYAGQKTLFDEVGYEKGNLMRTPDMIKDLVAWAQKERKLLEEKGIKVMDIKKLEQMQGQGVKEIQTWDSDYKEITAQLPKLTDAYCVAFKWERGVPEKQVWLYNPAKKFGTKPKKEEADEKALNLSRKEKLDRRVHEFNRTFMLNKSAEYIAKTPDETLHQMLLWKMRSEYNPTNAIYDKAKVEALFKMKTAEVRKELLELAQEIVGDMNYEALQAAAHAVGVRYEKDFKLSEEFLAMFTKEQLEKLAKELNLKIGDAKKKTEIIKEMLKGKPTKVPSVLHR